MPKYSITYDFGTGSVKGAIINAKHEPIASTTEAYPMYTPEPGFAEQKVEDYLSSFVKVTKRLLLQTNLTGEDIKGIVISQTSSSLLFADEKGKALCDCVTWVDSRAAEQAKNLNEMSGLDELATSKRVSAKIAWFLEKRPKVVAKAKYLLDVSAYMYLMLTGTTAMDLTAAYATGLIFPIDKEWNEAIVEMVGVDPALLPERIIDSFEIVGYTNTDYALEAGLVHGIPVFGGCSDNANGHLGTACINPGDAHIYMGSSGWLSVTTPIDDESASFNQLPSAIPGIGYEYFCTDSVGTTIDYLISTLYKEEADREDIYQLIQDEVKAIEDDEKQVLFLPYIFGEEAPIDDPNVRGTLLNVDSNVTRAHIMRAAMEGIGFNYRWIKENLKELDMWKVNFVRVIGGGAQSDAHVQIIADIMDEPIIRLDNTRFAGNIGLSMCIHIGLGEAKDFSELNKFIREEKTFHPRKKYRKRYDEMFEYFKRSYFSLKDLYTDMNG
ncbi:MAG: hypothetical protein GX241_02075 [Ruminococcaceae bacterium]|nr:hypothetical protein [Oscillospiraceae bacterium]